MKSEILMPARKSQLVRLEKMRITPSIARQMLNTIRVSKKESNVNLDPVKIARSVFRRRGRNKVIWCQQLEESERGWGCRPDGYILSLTLEDSHRHLKAAMDYQRKYFEDQGIYDTPDEYTRPAGEPYQCEITEQQLDTISDNGVRYLSNDWPKPLYAGAKLGWQKPDWGTQGRSC